MFSADISLWAFLGTFYLIYMTYQDLRNNRIIDDRNNYFMMGLTIGLNYIIKNRVWYIFFLVAVIIALSFVLKKTDIVGGADINTLAWMIFGFGLVGWLALSFFIIAFFFVNTIYLLFRTAIEKFTKLKIIETAYYPVLLLTFALSCGFLKLY